MQEIRVFFERLLPLADEEWQAMADAFEYVEFRAGENILNQGQNCDFIGFLDSGVVRFYHIKEGVERITAFWFAGDFLSNYRSFLSHEPSDHHIEALADGGFYRLRRAALHRLYNQFPNLDRLGRLMAEQLYLMVTRRLDNLLQDTPEERYRALLRKDSRLVQQIPQYMLASYVGVSPETLSRIRRRIAS